MTTPPFIERPGHPTRLIAPVVLAALALGAAGLTGCAEEEVKTYEVAKNADHTPDAAPANPGAATPVQPTPTPAVADPDAPGAGDAESDDPANHTVRMLGAIAPTGERTWYFKLLGPIDAVSAQADEFHKWVRSTEFTGSDDEPIKWDHIPGAWKREPAAGMRYATFLMGEGPDALQLSIIPLGPTSGSMKANVDRWRNQIGLRASTAEQLEATTEALQVGDVEVTIIDMTGPGLAANIPGMRPNAPFAPNAGGPAAPAAPNVPAPQLPGAAPSNEAPPIEVKLPPGWSKMKELPPFADVAYAVEQDGEQLVTTISALRGDGGGVEANLNRWANQIGGAEVEPRTVQVGGVDATYVDLVGPADDAGNRLRTLGVIVPRAHETWFIKLRGPADPVAAQRNSFEALVESIRFTDAK